jgi:hypothetical protein
MIITVNSDEFPNVVMKISGVVEGQQCVDRFKQVWMMGYAVYTTPFKYIIDTTGYEGDVNDMKYIKSLASFFTKINKDRKTDSRYDNLEKSIIIIDSPISKQLLTAIMSIATTVCPVRIVSTRDECSKYI